MWYQLNKLKDLFVQYFNNGTNTDHKIKIKVQKGVYANYKLHKISFKREIRSYDP